LDHEVVAGVPGLGAILSKARHGAIDEARIQGVQRRVIEAVLRETADLEVLDEDVGAFYERSYEVLASGSAEVGDDGALAAVATVEVRGLCPTSRWRRFVGFPPLPHVALVALRGIPSAALRSRSGHALVTALDKWGAPAAGVVAFGSFDFYNVGAEVG
jgi:hypothetical protein